MNSVMNEFFCGVCRLTFDKKIVFDIHNQIVHDIEIEDSEEETELTFKCSVEHCTHYFNNLVGYNRHFLLTHSKTIIQKQKHKLKTKEVIIEGQKQLLRSKEVIVCILERQIENAEEYVEHLKNQHDEHILCKICCQRKRKMIFQPCNHIYSCVRCGSDDRIIKCPVCRKRIMRKERVYFP